MAWLQLHIETAREQAAPLEQGLESLGALSVTLEDAGDEPILEPDPGDAPLWPRVRLSALFAEDTDPDGLRSGLEQLFALESGQFRLEWLQDQPWERAWLAYFRPLCFRGRLWICPDGQRVDATGAAIVDLDPGLAFGTGSHATTALCLDWLASANLEGREVIDFGCGSGILAIAALRLGARRAHAVDHDPQAILACRENADRNQVLDRLRLYGPGEPLAVRADLVMANIISGTLIRLADTLIDHLNPGGTLLLSGILAGQVEQVVQAYAGRIRFRGPELREGWALLEGGPLPCDPRGRGKCWERRERFQC
jgi:ribosomal protein L11 methyltransferase